MDSAENGRWIIPFKKFGMIRVKLVLDCAQCYLEEQRKKYQNACYRDYKKTSGLSLTIN